MQDARGRKRNRRRAKLLERLARTTFSRRSLVRFSFLPREFRRGNEADLFPFAILPIPRGRSFFPVFPTVAGSIPARAREINQRRVAFGAAREFSPVLYSPASGGNVCTEN